MDGMVWLVAVSRGGSGELEWVCATQTTDTE